MTTTTILDSESDLATPRAIKARLGLMMFLQYFVQGCYLPMVSLYLGQHLKFDSHQISLFNSALMIGPLLAPLVVGQLVDRHFATERVLAVCHAAAGIVMLGLYTRLDFTSVMVLGTLYSVLYVPTMMLTNSLALAHLRRRDREFPRIRIYGTFGFIATAWLVEHFLLRGMTEQELIAGRGIGLALAGISGLVMGAYCLTLPRTPPQPRAAAHFAPGVVAGMLRRRNVLVLVLVSFLIAMVHNYYFVWNSPYLHSILHSGGIEGAWEQRIASLGQVGELAVMAALGWAISHWGFKRVMLIGALAYLFRSLLLAAAAGVPAPFPLTMTLVCTGEAMHGLCFGCFMAAAYIYVDRIAPRDVRGSMQTLYGTFIMGLGALAGALLAGPIGTAFEINSADEADHEWSAMWLASAALAAVAAATFALLFPRAADETASTV